MVIRLEIREVKKEELKDVIELIWKTFLEYEAPDYTEEGIKEFEKTINDKKWIEDRKFFGAFEDDKIVGVIAIKNDNHIALFFVDGKYHRRGIGKSLYNEIKKNNKTGFFTVNSSPYAHEVYKHLGFYDLDGEQTVNGLRFFPMKVILKDNCSKLKYRLPKIEDEKIVSEYVKEHYDNNEKELHGSNRLDSMNFIDWVKQIENNTKISAGEWGRSLTYLVFNDDKLIGLLNIRYELSEELKEKYGDIGYGVRPLERRKGYATQMLRFAIDECKNRKMESVILGCYKDNLASSKTIIKNGGVLIKESKIDEKDALYYEIKL